jgi:hypothetical protein
MYRLLLILHIIAGTTALSGGLLAILSRKGKKPHKLSGLWFSGAMYLVCCSAVLLSLIRPNPFLLSIGIFSAYLTYSGRRAIFYWRLRAQHTPAFSEKLPVMLAFLTALGMVIHPLYNIAVNHNTAIPVSIIFGAIMLASTIGDFIRYSNPDNFVPGNNVWLFRHIAMMGGAYISATTAFFVVNAHNVPFWIPWLLPTVAGTVIITFSIRKWKHKMTKPQGTERTAL